MTKRLPCPAAPGPLEGYAACFDDLFSALAQRRGFREYLTGLLAPRDRNKTLTALAGAEPVAGAQHPAVQRQFFLTESVWDPDEVNARRVELLLADPATAHVGRQWLGRYGKTDNGIVTVTTLWADGRVCYPLHAMPYTPAHHFPKGKNDPGFRTKLRIAVEVAGHATAAGVRFRAVVADCAYGDQDTVRAGLRAAGLPFVMALKPRRGVRAYGEQARTPVDAARDLAWDGPDRPGDWTRVQRSFRDGHTETWWAAEASLGWWGPDGTTRLVVATTDPATLPGKATWYLATGLPRPGGPRVKDSPHPPADLAEIVRIYGIRNWIEHSYKQVKDELGWADFQVRSGTAIRRHQTLVNCAFSFCWAQWFTGTDPDPPALRRPAGQRPAPVTSPEPPRERGIQTVHNRSVHNRQAGCLSLLATRSASGPQLADPGDHAHALVAGMVTSAPA